MTLATAIAIAQHAASEGTAESILVLADALEEAACDCKPGFVLALAVRRCHRRQTTRYLYVELGVSAGWRPSNWAYNGRANYATKVEHEYNRRLRHPEAFSPRANRRFARALLAVLLFGEWSTAPWHVALVATQGLWLATYVANLPNSVLPNIPILGGEALDRVAENLYGLSRTGDEPDGSFRQRIQRTMNPQAIRPFEYPIPLPGLSAEEVEWPPRIEWDYYVRHLTSTAAD